MIKVRSRYPNALQQSLSRLKIAFISGEHRILPDKTRVRICNRSLKSRKASTIYLPAKRVLDVSLALLALLMLSPLIFVISVLIKIDSPGSIFFLQKRVGKNGKYFTILKFRTLYVEHFGVFTDREAPEDFRITRVGKRLRRYKVDEIPQFINVLLGNMSIVGPRPDIPVQVQQYTVSQYDRLLVKPGLTGISQVSGNTMLSWPERIVLDIWYIRHRTWLLDIKIIGYTLVAIVKGESLDADPFSVHGLLPGRKIRA